MPGALAVTTAMLLLVYTVVSAQQAGWASIRTIGSFAGVAVLLGRVHRDRAPEPGPARAIRHFLVPARCGVLTWGR